jgi:hypothetical protein
MTLIVDCNVTNGYNISLGCNLSELFITDKSTYTPNFSEIVSVKKYNKNVTSEENNKDIFSLKFVIRPENAMIHIATLPLQIVFNKYCIQDLLTLFSTPNSSKSKSNRMNIQSSILKSKRLSIVSARVLSAATPLLNRQRGNDKTPIKSSQYSNFKFDIVFEAHAPKIIIPEDSSSDKSYLLLDAGYLALNGSISAEGISLDFKLSDVNAGMPNSLQNIYDLNDQKLSLYLIKV